MTAVARDAWADARAVAMKQLLVGDLAARRRRLFLRRALGFCLGGAAVLGTFFLINPLLDPDLDGLWSVSLPVLWGSFALMGVALVLVIVGAVRTAGAARPFVTPDAFLSASDRSWLRSQVAEGRPVPEERRAVVADAARQMMVEGRYVPTYLGLTLLYVGLIVSGASLGSLVLFVGLITWMLVRIVRGTVRARGARRWLAQNA
ncbi:hypothetical protein GCM10022197_25940 [Microlunatus spumicola]|uniref:Sensor n=1 Tax=Microlunatus spumicola TaxID=81499 RepID=A0ABP6XLU8_9ACTN